MVDGVLFAEPFGRRRGYGDGWPPPCGGIPSRCTPGAGSLPVGGVSAREVGNMPGAGRGGFSESDSSSSDVSYDDSSSEEISMTTNREVVTGYLAGLVGTSLPEEGWESLTPSWSSVGSMTAGPLEQCGS